MGPAWWAAPLGPVHLVPALWERKVRRNDRSVSGPSSLSLTLMHCGGAQSVALARDTWEEFVGVRWGCWVSVCAR